MCSTCVTGHGCREWDRVTRYTLSSSWRMLRQVSPVVFSTNAQQKQCQPARLDVGADAVLR